MRRLIGAFLLTLIPLVAFAQQAPDYSTTACIQKLGEEVQGELQLRVAILQLQHEVQDLQDQLKAAKAKK